ncbi:response regulator transcription factor [Paenibacillus sp. Soil787]|uniref:response regulator transcription factor n=1 Tax=Paenibacillus sp. Soil787 TaxID=1736411 RepID=UPI000702D685|nr:response regulator transcription factor [Paenibacillus sp. Soil787]KRF18629.1 two-component system response regulator [Paenibacillus sp. Soil787]
MAHVLVVDDEKNMRNLLRIYLSNEGFEVTEAENGYEALELQKLNTFDLIILDIMMPGIDGLDVCRHIRESKQTPILMLTARSETKDKVQGLKLGADDYLVKPFEPEELAARVSALLRRANLTVPSTELNNVIRLFEMVIHPERREVFVGEQLLDLTPKEFDLLFYVASHPKTVLTREILLDQIWAQDYLGDIRTVDTHVKTIREKFRKADFTHNPIQTVWGVGYKFQGIDEKK